MIRLSFITQLLLEPGALVRPRTNKQLLKVEQTKPKTARGTFSPSCIDWMDGRIALAVWLGSVGACWGMVGGEKHTENTLETQQRHFWARQAAWKAGLLRLSVKPGLAEDVPAGHGMV